MKKSIPAFLAIFLTSLVSAGPVEGVEQLLSGLKQVIVLIVQFVSDTILNINSFDEFLFAKLLLFSIILLVVYTVIKKNPILGDNKTIHWIISSAIGILSIRYLSDGFIEAILLQYGALAVAIGVFLPWAIFFFFLHQSKIGPFGRRIGWIVFATAFYSMWWIKDENLGDAKWIYIIATIFIFISIFADKSIHKYFELHELKSMGSIGRLNRRINAQKELEALRDREEFLSKDEYKKLKDHWTNIYLKNAK